MASWNVRGGTSDEPSGPAAGTPARPRAPGRFRRGAPRGRRPSAPGGAAELPLESGVGILETCRVQAAGTTTSAEVRIARRNGAVRLVPRDARPRSPAIALPRCRACARVAWIGRRDGVSDLQKGPDGRAVPHFARAHKRDRADGHGWRHVGRGTQVDAVVRGLTYGRARESSPECPVQQSSIETASLTCSHLHHTPLAGKETAPSMAAKPHRQSFRQSSQCSTQRPGCQFNPHSDSCHCRRASPRCCAAPCHTIPSCNIPTRPCPDPRHERPRAVEQLPSQRAGGVRSRGLDDPALFAAARRSRQITREPLRNTCDRGGVWLSRKLRD